MPSPSELLWPDPQVVEATEGGFDLPTRISLDAGPASEACAAAFTKFHDSLLRFGCAIDRSGASGAKVRLHVDPALHLPPQGYEVRVTPSAMEVVAADAPGLNYGITTLHQWLQGSQPTGDCSRRIPAVFVRDWPDLPLRGAVLDISRDRVPTMETLRHLVDRLADWKINHLQLYMEHTFAYRGHEVVWGDASPLTGEEIRRLDGWCRERAIELVPNQNSFGHLHRWLVHEPYRDLAECPAGIEHPFSDVPEPFSLCPTDPRSLALLEDLYDQLLPCFSSSLFNVGLDETLDLGSCRSAETCVQHGRQTVYLEFLQAVHGLVAARGRRMLFWADMLADSPDSMQQVPSDALPIEWGYEAGHPFRDRLAALTAAGLTPLACAGTSSWSSFAGRTDNALHNLSEATAAVAATGAGGLLIADWGDFGHLQPLSVSYAGLLAGAGLAWKRDLGGRIDDLRRRLPDLIDRHALGAPGCGLGQVASDLGDVYRQLDATPVNGTQLFKLVAFSRDSLTSKRFVGLSAPGLSRVRERVESARRQIEQSIVPGSEASLTQRELTWVAEMLVFACDLGSGRLSATGDRTVGEIAQPLRAALAHRIGTLQEEFGRLWHLRSRPGGFDRSVARLQRLATDLG